MFLENLRRLWQALRRDPTSGEDLKRFRPVATRAVVWLLVWELIALLELYPLKLLVDGLSTPEAQLPFGLSRSMYFAVLCVIVLAIWEVGNTAYRLMDNQRNTAGWLFYILLDEFGNRKQLSLGADWHTGNSSGKKESVFLKNLKKVDYVFDNLIWDIIPLTVRVVFIAIGTFFIGWQFGVLAVLSLAAYAAMIGRTERKLAPMRKDFRSYTKRIEQSDSELSSASIVIKEQGLEDDMAEAHRKLMFEHLDKEIVRHGRFSMLIFIQDHAITLSRVLFYAASYLSFRAGATIGAIVLANAWMERIYANMWRYSNFQYVLNEGSEALKELVELFEREPSIKQPDDPKWPSKTEGRVQLKNVTFRYPGTDKDALANVNLTIEPGTTVALVGPSGGGKSTLARLMQHQYDPTHGKILVDGVDLREIDDKQYRKVMLGSVPQEPGLFDRSVERNIGMVRPEATRAQVVKAAKQASADEFILGLPKGYDTLVGERGIMLSGGQRQRVAIARALLRRPPILVLDEPTSALDAESQLWIKQTLEKLTASRASTILIIAHRFSTIEMADLVVVMEDGRVSEVGTHEQLKRRNGLYLRLRKLEGLLD